MKVKCINNTHTVTGKSQLELTVGKVYPVLKELENTYIIMNDFGNKQSSFKDRFVVVR